MGDIGADFKRGWNRNSDDLVELLWKAYNALYELKLAPGKKRRLRDEARDALDEALTLLGELEDEPGD